jgi:hypothetical protein
MHPYIMHTQIVLWMRENTTASLDEANLYASGCVSRFGNPEPTDDTSIVFKPNVDRRVQMLALLRILASDQPHRVATVDDRYESNYERSMTLWFAYKPSNGIILAFVSTWDLHQEGRMRTMYAKKLKHGESRILNRLLSTTLGNYKVLRLLVLNTVYIRECLDLNSFNPDRRFGRFPDYAAPYWHNNVAYECTSHMIGSYELNLELLPMTLNCAGWILLDDQELTREERHVKNNYVHGGRLILITFRCDKGVIGYRRIEGSDFWVMSIWGPSVRARPREVIEV